MRVRIFALHIIRCFRTNAFRVSIPAFWEVKAFFRLSNRFANLLSCILVFPLFIGLFACFSAVPADAVEIKKSSTAGGLTILHVERRAIPMVAVTLLIKASPLNENPEKAGLANLTAKMLMEGTAKRKSIEIGEDIEFLGASLNVSVNRDYTTITMTVLKKELEKGFEIYSDILLNPAFPENEIKRKKDLIRGSLRQSEEDHSFVAGRAFRKDVFGSHPYGRLIEGTLESLDNIQREDIVRFYNEHYLPQNSILSVVGDITSDELNMLINAFFNQWLKKSKASALTPLAPIPALTGSKITVIDRDITQANIIIGHKGVSRDNPDYYDIVVMNYLLGGGGFASRLMKIVRDEMGLTYSIHSSFSPNKEPGEFSVEVQTKNESAKTVIKEILKQMQKMRAEPVAEQELSDAKAFLTGSFPRRLETSRKISDFLALIEFYNLGEDFIRKYPDYINKVSEKTVQRAAEKYLDPTNYVIVIAGKKEKIDLSK